MVKVAVLVKQTPDVEAVRVDPRTGQPDFSGVGVKVSDYDKNAVEAAVQLKEKKMAEKVVSISLGGSKLEESVKEVLAMGCDEAYLVRDDAFKDIDTAEKARVLAAEVRNVGDVGIVIASEESADSHSAQTGPRVAAELGWPFVGFIVGEFRVEGNKLHAERESDEGVEVVECELPAVVTVLEALNEPRLPALMQILQAKNKPQHAVSAGDVNVEQVSPKVARVKLVAPKSERKQQIIQADSPDEAAEMLAKELTKQGVVK